MKKYTNDQCCVPEIDIDTCICQAEETISMVGKKWSLLIVGLIGNYGKLRFTELKEKLRGVSPKSLSDRLKELKKTGIIERRIIAEVPARVEYSLTKKGKELRKIVLPLIEWSSKN